MNWTPQTTVAAIENTWGAYKPGMKAVVMQHMNGSSSIYLESLFEVMTESHSGGWPPTKADMIKAHGEIMDKSQKKVDRIPVSHRLAESTEEYVDPEVGLKMIQDIINRVSSLKAV